MAKVHEMLNSKFLKKEDVEGDVTVTIKSLERLNVALDGSPPEMRWCAHFIELPRPLVMNSTNLQMCEKIFHSDESDDWVGQRLVLFHDPNVSFQGKLTGGIRIRGIPASSRLKPPAKAKPPVREVVDDDIEEDVEL